MTGMCRRRVIGLEALQHFVAIHFRHHDVEQHQVEGLRAQHFQRLPSVFGGGDRVALPLQAAREHVAIRFDVIHDEQRIPAPRRAAAPRIADVGGWFLFYRRCVLLRRRSGRHGARPARGSD